MRWKKRHRGDWNVWFAWHPIEIAGEYIWLERVERMLIVGQWENYYIYKNIDE